MLFKNPSLGCPCLHFRDHSRLATRYSFLPIESRDESKNEMPCVKNADDTIYLTLSSARPLMQLLYQQSLTRSPNWDATAISVVFHSDGGTVTVPLAAVPIAFVKYSDDKR